MEDKCLENAVTFHELPWDTEFFGVSCGKVILHKPLTQTQWDCVRGRFENYQFISIENRNSDPSNARLIGTNTTAFLADVNIQFKKKLYGACGMPEEVKIYQEMRRDERILKMADFPFSKFTEDPELNIRGGHEVYLQWLINSFENPGKFFAVAEGTDGEMNGYLLYSYSNRTCTVELIAVSNNKTRGGIGANLFRAVENVAYQFGCDEIRVGTQVRNIGAINFYNKIGCKQSECHQVYHLWNI